MPNGSVNISGGTIRDNHVNQLGGGVRADKVKITGGTITGNSAYYYGGGVYANEVEITGGTISGNSVAFKQCRGGGVWATKITMQGGTISGNTSSVAGGGVYTTRMTMTGGTISDNNVRKGEEISDDNDQKDEEITPDPLGGGGIFIDAGTKVCDDETGIWYNMLITGGTISGNTSDHVGGGIFVNRDAAAYIRGMDGGIVDIEDNVAFDKYYVFPGGDPRDHGFAGGGIFVEHDDDTGREGEVYIYNAVITENIARYYGGGVAGCGSSKVEICSVDGVAIYGNRALCSDERYPEYTVDSSIIQLY